MNVWIACGWRTVLHSQVLQTSRPDFARCTYVNKQADAQVSATRLIWGGAAFYIVRHECIFCVNMTVICFKLISLANARLYQEFIHIEALKIKDADRFRFRITGVSDCDRKAVSRCTK